MTRLNEQARADRAADVDATSVLPIDAKIEPSERSKSFLDAEYLSTLLSVTRRPPELRALPNREPRKSVLDAIFLPEIQPISEQQPGDLAYSVAELAVRLDGPVNQSEDEGAQEGLAVLSEMARMYEHLFVMQVGPGGQ